MIIVVILLVLCIMNISTMKQIYLHISNTCKSIIRRSTTCIDDNLVTIKPVTIKPVTIKPVTIKPVRDNTTRGNYHR